MKEYICTRVVDLHTGCIGLTKEQSDRRASKLRQLPGQPGIYEIKERVQFKAGEIVKLQNPDKATLAKVEPTQPDPPAENTAEEEPAAAKEASPAKKTAGGKGKKK